MLLVVAAASAQTVLITDNPDLNHGHPSATLDIVSETGGLLIPRMTEIMRQSIMEPATGLLVYQTDAEAGFYYNGGTPQQPQWKPLGAGGSNGETTGNSIIHLWDVDGNVYAAVAVGGHYWMMENLRTTRYRDGTPIPLNPANWTTANQGGMAWYDHMETLGQSFGGLYNWHAVSDARGLCPVGWEVPQESHWEALATAGGSMESAAPRMQAGKFWDGIQTLPTNATGLSALPGGLRSGSGGHFDGLRQQAGFWTSTAAGSNARAVVLQAISAGLEATSVTMRQGLSVRCVKPI